MFVCLKQDLSSGYGGLKSQFSQITDPIERKREREGKEWFNGLIGIGFEMGTETARQGKGKRRNWIRPVL